MEYVEDGITFDDGIDDETGEIVEVDDVAPFEDDAYAAQFDDDPSPYAGTYSEE